MPGPDWNSLLARPPHIGQLVTGRLGFLSQTLPVDTITRPTRLRPGHHQQIKGYVVKIEYDPEIKLFCGTVINATPNTFYGASVDALEKKVPRATSRNLT